MFASRTLSLKLTRILLHTSSVAAVSNARSLPAPQLLTCAIGGVCSPLCEALDAVPPTFAVFQGEGDDGRCRELEGLVGRAMNKVQAYCEHMVRVVTECCPFRDHASARKTKISQSALRECAHFVLFIEHVERALEKLHAISLTAPASAPTELRVCLARGVLKEIMGFTESPALTPEASVADVAEAMASSSPSQVPPQFPQATSLLSSLLGEAEMDELYGALEQTPVDSRVIELHRVLKRSEGDDGYRASAVPTPTTPACHMMVQSCAVHIHHRYGDDNDGEEGGPEMAPLPLPTSVPDSEDSPASPSAAAIATLPPPPRPTGTCATLFLAVSDAPFSSP